MALTVGELVGYMKLDKSEWNRDLAAGERDLAGIDGKAKSLLKGVGVVAGAAFAAAGAAVIGFGKQSFDTFVEFDTRMREVFTLLPDLSGKAQRRMTQDVKAFSREMGVTTDKTIPALYQALSAGVGQRNVFDFLRQSQRLAKSGVTDLEVSVDALTSVVNAYGPKTLSAARASDMLFTAVKEGKTRVDLLGQSVGKVTPLAAALGVSFADVTGALATITLGGVETAEATTYLRGALAELGKGGTIASDAFKKISGETFPEFIRSGGDLEQALSMMREAADKNGKSVGDMFGSVEAGMAVLALTGQNADTFREKIDAMNDSAGATREAHRTMSKSAGQSLQDLSAWWDVLKVNVGEKVQPVVERVTRFLKRNGPEIEEAIVGAFEGIVDFIDDDLLPALESVSDWWSENGKGIAADSAAIGDSLDELGSAMSGLTGVFQSETKKQGKSFDVLSFLIRAPLQFIRKQIDDAALTVGLLTSAAEFLKTAGSQYISDFVSSVTSKFESLLRGAALVADGLQMPGLAASLRSSADRIRDFRDDANSALDGIDVERELRLDLNKERFDLSLANARRNLLNLVQQEWKVPMAVVEANVGRTIYTQPKTGGGGGAGGGGGSVVPAEDGLVANRPTLAFVGESYKARRGGGEIVSPAGLMADTMRSVLAEGGRTGASIGSLTVLGEIDPILTAKVRWMVRDALENVEMSPAAGG